jgi:hypothetical protein
MCGLTGLSRKRSSFMCGLTGLSRKRSSFMCGLTGLSRKRYHWASTGDDTLAEKHHVITLQVGGSPYLFKRHRVRPPQKTVHLCSTVLGSCTRFAGGFFDCVAT